MCRTRTRPKSAKSESNYWVNSIYLTASVYPKVKNFVMMSMTSGMNLIEMKKYRKENKPNKTLRAGRLQKSKIKRKK